MPLMMTGTPGRPGIAMTGPLSAKAADVAPIKMASAIPARILGFRFLSRKASRSPWPNG